MLSFYMNTFEVELLGHMVRICLTFQETQLVFKMAMPFTLQECMGIPADLHPCQNLVLSDFKI